MILSSLRKNANFQNTQYDHFELDPLTSISFYTKKNPLPKAEENQRGKPRHTTMTEWRYKINNEMKRMKKNPSTDQKTSEMNMLNNKSLFSVQPSPSPPPPVGYTPIFLRRVPLLIIWQPRLNQSDSTPALNDPGDNKAGSLNDILELGRRALDAIDGSSHAKIALVTIAGVVSVVGWERVGSGDEFWASEGGVHDLVADEDAGLGGHAGADGGENLHTVIVGPVMSVVGFTSDG